MTVIHFYLILSAVGVLLSDNFFAVFKESYSWWLVPLLFVAFFLCFIILQALLLVITILTVNMNKPARGERFFRFQVKLILPVILGVARVKINHSGTELVTDNSPKLFVCNHQYDFDPVIIYSCFPDADLSFIGKKDILTEMKFISKAMYLLRCLFIDRENDREAAKTIISAIKRLKAKENSIGLFPEGYCSKTCELQPIRNGSLKIALKSKVPVVICVINNTREIPKRIFRKETEVDFRVLEVLPPEFYENISTAELGDYIYEKMNTALKEIRC